MTRGASAAARGADGSRPRTATNRRCVSWPTSDVVVSPPQRCLRCCEGRRWEQLEIWATVARAGFAASCVLMLFLGVKVPMTSVSRAQRFSRLQRSVREPRPDASRSRGREGPPLPPALPTIGFRGSLPRGAPAAARGAARSRSRTATKRCGISLPMSDVEVSPPQGGFRYCEGSRSESP